MNEESREKRKLRQRIYNKNYREKDPIAYRKYQREYYRTHSKKKDGEFVLGSNCEKGRKFELLALKILSGSKDSNKKSFRGKFDITWDGYKIDVKAREKDSRGQWRVITNNNKDKDYYLLFCLTKDKIKKIYLIPSSFTKSSITIGKKSKFDKFKLSPRGIL